MDEQISPTIVQMNYNQISEMNKNIQQMNKTLEMAIFIIMGTLTFFLTLFIIFLFGYLYGIYLKKKEIEKELSVNLLKYEENENLEAYYDLKQKKWIFKKNDV